MLFWGYELALLLGIALVIRMRTLAETRSRPALGDRTLSPHRVTGSTPMRRCFETRCAEAHPIESGASRTQNDSAAMVFEGTGGQRELQGNAEQSETQGRGQNETQGPEGVGAMANFNEQQNGRGKERTDQAWPGHVGYKLGFGSEQVSDMMWRCRVLRAGKLYSTSLFATKEEADEFARKLGEAEPDKMFNVEAIRAASVWN